MTIIKYKSSESENFMNQGFPLKLAPKIYL